MSADSVLSGHVLCSDELNRVRQQYNQLIEMLVARDVGVHMYERDALSLAELELIQNSKTNSDAAKHLLNVVLKMDDDLSGFQCFMEALEATNQQHILIGLTNPGEC